VKFFSKAFITGSRAYGTPREDSDLDLAILVSEKDLKQLETIADKEPDKKPRYDDPTYGNSLRFGQLNLVCMLDSDEYEHWKEITQKLIEIKPVTRKEAIDAICTGELPHKKIGTTSAETK